MVTATLPKRRQIGFAISKPKTVFRKGQLIYIHPWTEEEDAILRRDYKHSKISLIVLRKELGINKEVIRQRLYFLGIKKKDKGWSPHEDTLLTNEYSEMPTSVIARGHSRTERSITARACKLNLSKFERDGWFTMAEATEILGVDADWLNRRRNNGHHLDMKPFDLERPPKKGNCAPYYISRKSLRDFIRAYPNELSGHDVDLVTVVDILVGIKIGNNEAAMEEV